MKDIKNYLLNEQEQKLIDDYRKSNFTIKELSSYTPQDKIEWFNEIYSWANTMYNDQKNTGSMTKNAEHYVWEHVMQLLAYNTGDFWKHWNSLG